MIDLDTEWGRRASERLRTDLIAWFVTVRPDGTPIPVPVWFLWDGATILLYSQPRTGKLRNIAAHPRVSLHLRTDEEGSDAVIVTGDARVDAAAPPAHRVAAYVEKYGAQIAANGWSPETMAADYSVPIRVTPDRISGF